MAVNYAGFGQAYLKTVNSSDNSQLIVENAKVSIENIKDGEEETMFYNLDVSVPGIFVGKLVSNSIDAKDSTFPLKTNVNGLDLTLTSLDEEASSYTFTLTGFLNSSIQIYFQTIMEKVVTDEPQPEPEPEPEPPKPTPPKPKPKVDNKKLLALKENKKIDNELKKEIAEFLKSKKASE